MKRKYLQKQMNKFSDNEQEQNDLAGKLPLVITNISVQKKNKDRFSLFHENLFLTGVSSKTLLDYSLQKGVELTPSLFNRIKNSEEYHSIKESCLRYLGRRDHAAFELRQKITKKGYNREMADQVIEDLAQKGFINDEQFAIKFASDKFEFNQWGPKKIKAALIRKGIEINICEKVINKLTENLQQDQICVDLVLKRKKHFLREDDSYKRKQKIYSYLAGRGFSGSVIKRSIQQIDKKLDA